MEYSTYIYRDFNTKENIKQRFNISDQDENNELYNGYIGEISVYPCKNNKLIVQIDGLHNNDDIDENARQGILIIDYPDNIPLYNVIKIILNKLTEDYKYYLHENVKYKDFILCSEQFAKENQPLCNFDISNNYTGGIWMDFTQNNMQYIKLCETIPLKKNNNIIHYGNLHQDGTFTYDYPIISEYMNQEYYKITRGYCVWDIIYDHVSKKYIIDKNWRENIIST